MITIVVASNFAISKNFQAKGTPMLVCVSIRENIASMNNRMSSLQTIMQKHLLHGAVCWMVDVTL